MIDSSIVRTSYIGKKIKKFIDKKDLTLTELAKKIGSSQPTLSNSLKGKGGSDAYFTKVMKAIPLTETQIQEIFFEADVEEMVYKYPDKDIFSNRKMTQEEIENFIIKNYGISKEELDVRAKKS